MKPRLDVIGFGAMNLDEIALVPRILVDGETRILTLLRRPGGSAANTAYSLGRLGLAAGFVGAVGDDAAGRSLIEDLAKVGMDTSQVAVKRGEVSGLVWALADAAHRCLNVYPGANDLLGRRDVHLPYLRGARLVHLSSFVGAKQLALQEWAVRRLPVSVKISFAPGRLYAERGVAALCPILERTTVLFVNGDEARLLTRRTDLRSAARELIRLGCRTVVITLGAGGEIGRAKSQEPRAENRTARAERRAPSAERRVLRGRQGQLRAAGFATDGRVEEVIKPMASDRRVVDSVGAGDAFAAGFLYGVLSDRPLRECANLGQVVAQCSLQAPGARQGLPDPRQLHRTYRRLFRTPLA